MITFADTLASITDDQAPLTIPVGVTNEDTLKVLDLAKAPHILYAGATGSGKSVGLNAGIATLMKRNDPTNLRFTMVDPKRVELADYRASAFVDAVITDMDEAAEALEEVLKLMERRYREFETAGVKNISSYNDRFPNKPMAYHVLVVDELADLMDTHSDTVFPILVRLGQLARAAGIHMMLATQRPAADTTPKKLVSNIPTRIGFMTQSAVESRIILGSKGAEDLKGNGDLLAQLPGTKGLVRAQGPFISEDEIKEIVAENERTIVEVEAPEVPEAAKPAVTSDAPSQAMPAAPSAPAAPADTDTAEIVSQVIAQVTAQLEASAQAKVDAAEAERDEAKRKRDELADEVMAMQVKLKTTEAATAKRVDEVRSETRKSLEAVRTADEKRVNDRLSDADDAVRRATAKMRKAQGVAGRFVPWTLIGGAIASLLVAGLISVGASALAIAAPFVVGTIVALSLTNVATTEQERIDKETDNGEHLRSGAAKSGRGTAGRHASARRADSGGSR